MFYKCVLIFLACVAFTHQEPVKVTVYYESLCPASIRFITQQLYPTWRAFGDKAPRYMTLDLVPYGKATQTRNDSGWQFVCQHGQSECRGNKLQVCGLHALQRTAAEIAVLLSKLPASDNKTAAVSSEEVDDPLPAVGNATVAGAAGAVVPGDGVIRGVIPLDVPSSTPPTEATSARRRRRDAEDTTATPASTAIPAATEATKMNVDETTTLKIGEMKMDALPNSDVVVPVNGTDVGVVNAPDVIVSPDVSVVKAAEPYVSDYKMGTLEHNADQVATFIFCIMSVSKPEDALEACASGSSLSADTTAAITSCYNSPQGDDILAAYGDKTHAAVPKISLEPMEGHVPQVTFNGVYNADDETEAFDDFKSVICRKQTSSYLKNKCKKRRFGLQRPGSGFLVPLLAAGAGALGGYALGNSRNKQHGYPGSNYGNQHYPGQSSSFNPFGSGGAQQQYPGQTYNPYGSSGGQQFHPSQNQQYPGQTMPHNPAYGAGGVQQYPTQNQQYPGQSAPYGAGGVQQYPGQTAPHNPAYGTAGVQQYPNQNQQYPGQAAPHNPAYPGQTAPHNPAYGAGGVQQYPGQTAPHNPAYGAGGVQQYPGQTAPHNPAYGTAGVQQYPQTQNQAYQGQSAPTNQYGSGVAPQTPPVQNKQYPAQPPVNPNYAPNAPSAPKAPPPHTLSYPASETGVKPPAPGWVAPSSATHTSKPQIGWVPPTQSSRVTPKQPSASDKWVSASKQIVTRPPVTRPPATQAPRRQSASKPKPARKRKH